MVAGSVKTLMRMNNSLCHYCGSKTNVNDKRGNGVGKRYPTKDHVVPRAFGGINHISNYVLACSECNNRRGTNLFFCDCRNCKELILDAVYNNHIIDTIIDGIEKHNRPIIKKVSYKTPKGSWSVRIGHNIRLFHTFNQALEFAITDACVKDIDYENTQRGK